jgi:hypothetical protein
VFKTTKIRFQKFAFLKAPKFVVRKIQSSTDVHKPPFPKQIRFAAAAADLQH